MLTEVRNNIRYLFDALKISIKSAMAYKVSFLVQTIFMFFNNASFLIFWLVIFNHTGNSTDITFNNVLYIWSFSSMGYGIAYFFFGGIQKINEYIISGALDSYLLQPKNVLLNVATSKSSFAACGDILYGLVVAIMASGGDISKIIFVRDNRVRQNHICNHHIRQKKDKFSYNDQLKNAHAPQRGIDVPWGLNPAQFQILAKTYTYICNPNQPRNIVPSRLTAPPLPPIQALHLFPPRRHQMNSTTHPHLYLRMAPNSGDKMDGTGCQCAHQQSHSASQRAPSIQTRPISQYYRYSLLRP